MKVLLLAKLVWSSKPDLSRLNFFLPLERSPSQFEVIDRRTCSESGAIFLEYTSILFFVIALTYVPLQSSGENLASRYGEIEQQRYCGANVLSQNEVEENCRVSSWQDNLFNSNARPAGASSAFQTTGDGGFKPRPYSGSFDYLEMVVSTMVTQSETGNSSPDKPSNTSSATFQGGRSGTL